MPLIIATLIRLLKRCCYRTNFIPLTSRTVHPVSDMYIAEDGMDVEAEEIHNS